MFWMKNLLSASVVIMQVHVHPVPCSVPKLFLSASSLKIFSENLQFGPKQPANTVLKKQPYYFQNPPPCYLCKSLPVNMSPYCCYHFSDAVPAKGATECSIFKLYICILKLHFPTYHHFNGYFSLSLLKCEDQVA